MPYDSDIWAITTGDELEAFQTLPMEGGGTVCFTEGRHYRIINVLPLREPAAAVVVDDSGRENKIEPTFRPNFGSPYQPKKGKKWTQSTCFCPQHITR
ncbi:hypothetical protein [Cupriavidus taiwanensis]|uniref:Uncharacterized protein n=1 Tax=Cupriavidus taiwanensis TaxID=164546 RepID=A0A375JF02_9BURK|nr:hypothetical protein [Cupriavidus taiwanensis]SPS02583.1 hypothetical protein CBM2634_U180009 [Cupriavidus taiwanensis]